MKTKQKKVVKGKYKPTSYCINCNSELELLIPKGIEVEDYLKNKKCKVCGCLPINKPLKSR